jgi:hypothetical protein
MVGSPFMSNQPARQITETSFFTDESLKNEMRGTDTLWYNGLGSKKKSVEKLGSNLCEDFSNRQNTHNSNEQYKNMLSNNSDKSAANAVRLFAKATEMPVTPERLGSKMRPNENLFISKATFLESWHN